jgi:alginate O-acetyltransferase complex protein AlgI
MWLCLVASYIFYGWWDWRFIFLVMTTTVMDYSLGVWMEKLDDPRQRKNLVIFSVVANLTFLGFFKYFNFFIHSIQETMASLGVHANPIQLQIILPIGISFYTFQSMSYTIDVYKKEIKAEKDFFRFATFVVFFPQLVAGPIVRASQFLPQFTMDKKWNWDRFHSGMGQILWGFFKKVAIADSLASFSDQIFAAPESFGSLHLLIGVIFYSFQIYTDFSGYSDIAIGLARLLGFKFPDNFRTPYFSKNFSEFWTRWHVSLSSWLRDYLYIPLGGNRGGKWGTYKNNMLTMLIGGLWHGANIAFIFWGFLHGLYLILQRQLAPYYNRFMRALHVPMWIDNGISILIVYFLTCFAWIYFRAGSTGYDSFSVANKVISGIASLEGFSWGAVINKFQVLKGFFLISCLLLVDAYHYFRPFGPVVISNPIFRVLSFSTLLLLIALFGSFGANAFIYFQF